MKQKQFDVLKKTVALGLALVLLLEAPGFQAYAALGERSNPEGAMSAPVRIEINNDPIIPTMNIGLGASEEFLDQTNVRALDAKAGIPVIETKKDAVKDAAIVTHKVPHWDHLKNHASGSQGIFKKMKKSGAKLSRAAKADATGKISASLGTLFDGAVGGSGNSSDDLTIPGWKAEMGSGLTPPQEPPKSLDDFLASHGVSEKDRPGVIEKIHKMWGVLSIVGQAVGGESGLNFRIGSWWRTDIPNKTIYVPIEEVLKHLDEPDVLIGGVLHEAGHAFHTRWNQLPDFERMLEENPVWEQQSVFNLLNVLEDLYEENAVSSSWAGARHYHHELHEAYRPDLFDGTLALPKSLAKRKDLQEQEKVKKLFPHEEYLDALRSFWMTRQFPKPDSYVSGEVAQAVEKTSAAVKKILTMTTTGNWPSEEARVDAAQKRLKHIEDEILPHYKKLLALSRKRIEQEMQNQQNGQQGQQGKQSQQGQGDQADQQKPGDQQGQQGKQGQQGQGGPSEGQTEKQDDESSVKEKAEKTIDERAKETAKKLGPTHGDPAHSQSPEEQSKQDSVSMDPSQSQQQNGQQGQRTANAPGKPSQTEEGPKSRNEINDAPGATASPHNQGDAGKIAQRLLESRQEITENAAPNNEYEESLKRIAHLIDYLAGRLENIFMKNEKMTWEDELRGSGQKINIKKFIRSEASGWRNPDAFKVFQRRRLPTKRDHKFTLLIDLSGSMMGINLRHAQDMAVLFMEVLERLNIDYSLMGFDTSVYWLKTFVGEFKGSSSEQRAEIIGRMSKTGGGGTLDTEAVVAALKGDPNQEIEGLEEQAGEKRVLIVLTDGEGNGEASGHMSEVLEEAEHKNHIDVIGMGIGAGMAYVQERYKHHVLADTMTETVDKLVDLIEDLVKEGFSKSQGDQSYEK